MNCTYCNVLLSDHYTVSQEHKTFCNVCCMESYYINKIATLTKDEKAWKDEWYKSRDIIGRLGLEVMYLKHPEWRIKNA